MKSYLTKLFVVAIFACFLNTKLTAQEGYVPTEKNLENREWFQDNKYGLFVHWGVYSIMGGGGDQGIAEWIMERKNIPVAQYEKLPGFFNPMEFDAAEWDRQFEQDVNDGKLDELGRRALESVEEGRCREL